MARRRRARVNGPYRHRQRWRVFVILADGRRNARSFATEEEAQKLVKELHAKLAGDATVSDAIKGYLTWVRSRGVREVTVRNSERFLDRFFGGKTGYPVRRLTPSKAASLYDAMLTRRHYRGSGYAAATHRAALTEAKRFGAWCVKQGYLRLSPFASVEPVGRRKAGKKKLSSDEARRLLDYCLSAYANGNQHALIPLLCLGLALRASEVCRLDARHVTDGGRALWIEETKTAAGERTLEVPGPIAVCLAHQARGRVGQLIPGATPASVYHHVTRMCVRAGVTKVCPHGLRGTHATLAAGRGATSALLMEALGHTSIAVTRRHYVTAGTMDSARAGDVMRALRDPDAIDPVTRSPIDVPPDHKDED